MPCLVSGLPPQPDASSKARNTAARPRSRASAISPASEAAVSPFEVATASGYGNSGSAASGSLSRSASWASTAAGSPE
eukprot:3215510-Pyramimonas_sp.AAC.1